jgi:abequosyltransferase
MRLSICIATFRRAAYIGETLENILGQVGHHVEVVVVDGASPDDTQDVVRRIQARYPQLIYYREDTNEGVDRDFDKAVGYARGDYCWLMSDDDLLAPGAIERVLSSLRQEPDLVIVNAQVRTSDLAVVLQPNRLRMHEDRRYGAGEEDALFAATIDYLSFIGAVVIRRSLWLARDRETYFGSLFIHVGVIFQPPAISNALVIAEPLVIIRYGNAMWTARGFEIWIHKWPSLVWSFAQFKEITRAGVIARHPAESAKNLIYYRAIGAFGSAEFDDILSKPERPHHRSAHLIARLPPRAVNAMVALYCLVRRQEGWRMLLDDLARAREASSIARWVVKRFRSPEMER